MDSALKRGQFNWQMTLKLIQWLRWLRESVDSYAAQQVKHTQLKSVYLLILLLFFSRVLAWYYTVASSTRMKFFFFSNIIQCVGVVYVMCSIYTHICVCLSTQTHTSTHPCWVWCLYYPRQADSSVRRLFLEVVPLSYLFWHFAALASIGTVERWCWIGW